MEMSMIFMLSPPLRGVSFPVCVGLGTLFPVARSAHRVVLGDVPALGVSQIERAVDQPDMRERLGEIAEEPPDFGVDLLGEQADVVGEVGHVLKMLLASSRRPGKRQDIHQPEGA
jgi:hypothetical protein